MDYTEFKKELREKLGITYLFPQQELIISHIIANEENNTKTNLLASLPTGSGKSICFMAPAFFIKGITICIYPLLSLMADQERRMKDMGIKCVTLKGGQSKEERERLFNLLLDNEARVIITNIEMLVFLTKQQKMKGLWEKVRTIVLDEVHTVISWGDDFRPLYKELPYVLKTIKPNHILAFTATMDKKTTKEIINRVFCGTVPYIFHASSDRGNIFYHSIRTLNKRHDLLKLLSNKENLPSVVFSSSKAECEEISSFLNKEGIESMFYHAGLDKDERKRRENIFYSSNTLTLVSTCAFGLGVDKKGIRSTIHLYLPLSASEFLQEAGRGGRDGKRCHSYVLLDEKSKGEVAEAFSKDSCIRRELQKLMNEEIEEDSCFGCSKCIEDNFVRAGEEEILFYLSKHIFRRKDKMIKTLSSPSLFSKRNRLQKWKKKEIEKGIEILSKEKLIKEKFNLLQLTSKGKKRLLNIMKAR